MIYIRIDTKEEATVNVALLRRLVSATGIPDQDIRVYSNNSGIDLPAFTPPKQARPQSTFYCLFLPLGLYCQFGASNIHHAYNKAAKYWGSHPSEDTVGWPEHKFTQDCRIMVFPSHKPMMGYKEIRSTLMTKLVKAWREENA